MRNALHGCRGGDSNDLPLSPTCLLCPQTRSLSHRLHQTFAMLADFCWTDVPSRVAGYTMTVSALVFSKAKRFLSAPAVRQQRRLLFRPPPRHMRSDVASYQRWALNKIAVEPQASPGADWSSPALGHEVSLQSALVPALDFFLPPPPLAVPLFERKALKLNDWMGEFWPKLCQSGFGSIRR